MDDQDFLQANLAFDRMQLHERERVLEEFAQLRYPSIKDRFFEAVYQTLQTMRTKAVTGQDK